MDRLIERVRVVSRYGVWFGGGLLVLSAVLVGVEVLVRKAYNLTLGGVDELSGFALAIGSAWAFAFALLDRAHVRIDSVYIWLPKRVGVVLDILGLSVFLVLMALFAWQAMGVFSESLAMDSHTMTVLATPLKYPQFLWVAGLFYFVFVAALLLFRAVLTLFRGDLAGVQRQIGSRSVVEEVDDELHQINERKTRDGDGDGDGG